jgi:hypothetical protein
VLIRTIRQLPRRGRQDHAAARAYILKDGAIATSGDAREVAAHPELVMFYLGG